MSIVQVIVRRRATRYLESLHQNLTDSLREGSFFQSSARLYPIWFLFIFYNFLIKTHESYVVILPPSLRLALLLADVGEPCAAHFLYTIIQYLLMARS